MAAFSNEVKSWLIEKYAKHVHSKMNDISKTIEGKPSSVFKTEQWKVNIFCFHIPIWTDIPHCFFIFFAAIDISIRRWGCFTAYLNRKKTFNAKLWKPNQSKYIYESLKPIV